MAAGGVPAGRLLHARGIDRDTASRFRVGLVGDDAFPGHERHRGKLAIPYLDRKGQPLSMRFRCIAQHDCRDHGHGKYMGLVDEPTRMFNVRAVHEADDEIHVTEGEFDAMVLNRIGLPAVAVPGVQNWKSHHRRMLAGFSRVWVWGDPDDAGADFNRRLAQSLRQAKAVRLRAGDVTDTFKAGGASALLSLIDRGDNNK